MTRALSRYQLQAAMVSDVLHVTGGSDRHHDFTSILAWDPVAESWRDVGDLSVARYDHAIVAIKGSAIKCA